MKNMGKWDRVIRLFVGVGILMFLPRTTWALLGLVPVATAMIGFCPLYRIFGWSTVTRTPTTHTG